MATPKSLRSRHGLPALRKWMKSTGTTQQDLARWAKASQGQISAYLCGKQTLPMERAIKLALVTGLPVQKLLSGPTASQLLKLLVDRSNDIGGNAAVLPEDA